jgi:succinyl-CoA synthetase (ADP-forming) beta subunit (EC 6.2.1.5)
VQRKCYHSAQVTHEQGEEQAMKLHEYQARDILARYGIPVTGGGVATTPAEARAIAEQIGGRVVVKAQYLWEGAARRAGVKLADTPEQAEQVASQILGMNIKGLTVEKVLVAEAHHLRARDLPGRDY